MENNNNNNSSSHGAGVVALPGCFAPRLNADGSTCDQTYTRASPAAVVVAGASSPQAPAQQHSATCKLDGCSDAAVFAFEGDALGSYCEVHKPIIEQVEAEAGTQPCFFKGCTRGVSHGWDHVRALSSCLTHKQPGMIQMRGVPCEFPGCQAKPSYALEGELQSRCCKKHVSPGMVFVDYFRCSAPNCQRSAIWVEATDNRQRACREHRRAGIAYAQVAAICAAKDCFQEACYGLASSSGRPFFCPDHKTDGMTLACPRTCATPGCCKVPGYGVDGKRQVCRDHKTEAMTCAVLTCESPLCNKNPSFAPRGETRRRFCKRHAQPGMVNVYYKYCGVDRCPERASFEAGGKLRCLEHCEAGMKPRNNICRVEGGGCTRQSSYGIEGGKPVVCTLHKVPGMVQVRTKRCKFRGCKKIPSYGFSCKSREYCKPHALQGMVYSAGNRCRFRGCSASGVYNHPGVRGGSFCQDHKEDGMVDIRRKKCEVAGCRYAASYGDTVERTKRFCARHKLDGMFSYQDLWPRPGIVAKTSATGQVSSSFDNCALGAQDDFLGVLAGAGAGHLSAVTSPPETFAASGGASVNPLACEAGDLVAGVRAPTVESGTAVSGGTVTASPRGAEGTREEAAESSALASTPGPTPSAPSPTANIAATTAVAATGVAADSASSAAAAAAAAAAGSAVAAAGPTATVPAAGTFAAGFVRPGAPRKAQSTRRAKRPRKESSPGNLAPAPDTSRSGGAFPSIPPFVQFLLPGGSGGVMFSPGLSYPGFMGQWNWLAAGLANASMATAAGINGGGAKTQLPLPLPLPSPFSSISAQAVESFSTPGPTMGLASLKDAAAAAAAAAPTPGTLGFHPGHYPSPATSIATAPSASGGDVAQAQAQAQADRASDGSSVSSSAAVDNETGTPSPSLPPSFFSTPGPTMGLASLKDAAAAAAAAAPTPGTLGFHPGHYPSPATSIATAPSASGGDVAQAQAQAQADRASDGSSVSSSAAVDNETGTPSPSLPPSFRADKSSSAAKAVAVPAPHEESSSPQCHAPQDGSVSDSSERWAGEVDEEEIFLATLVNSMDASSLKTVGVRRAMMSRLKNVGRTIAG